MPSKDPADYHSPGRLAPAWLSGPEPGAPRMPYLYALGAKLAGSSLLAGTAALVRFHYVFTAWFTGMFIGQAVASRLWRRRTTGDRGLAH